MKTAWSYTCNCYMYIDNRTPDPQCIDQDIYVNLFWQATIGIDFLSKTMYLEDRTVSLLSN